MGQVIDCSLVGRNKFRFNKGRVGCLDVLSKRQFILSGSDEPSVCGEETMFLEHSHPGR